MSTTAPKGRRKRLPYMQLMTPEQERVPNTRRPGCERQLTERQRQMLHYIAEREAKAIPPTIREIGRHMGIRSTNGVVCHLEALLARGLIQARSQRARTFRLAGCSYERVYDDSPLGRRLREALEGGAEH